MWGCMAWEGIGYAAKIDGKLDADLHVGILEVELQKTLEWYDKTPVDIIFQQDNDPKHISKKAKELFETYGFQVIKWPAQLPDSTL